MDTTFTMVNVQLIVQLEHIGKKMEYVLIVIIHAINVMDQMTINARHVGETQI